MRSFLSASLILLGVIILIACNSIAAIRTVDNLLGICREISDGIPGADNRLFTNWQRCSDFLSLSTHHNEIERAEFAVYSICEHSEDSAVQLSILISTLQHIADSQRFHWTSIF